MAVWTKSLRRFVPPLALQYSQKGTVDGDDVCHLNSLAEQWWDENGRLKPLHTMNEVRIKFIVQGLVNTGRINKMQYNKPEPLEGVKLLDVGCGGGILTEPLGRLGANATGLDPGEDLIRVAQIHAGRDPTLSSHLCYLHTTVEEHAENNNETYDVIVASEVIEHVADPVLFVDRCVSTLKPGGSFFLTTINKTTLSWFLGVILAEKVFGLIPDGTHRWEKFISVKESQSLLDSHGCSTLLVHGMIINPLTYRWSWSKYDCVSYALHAVKRRGL